MNPSRGPMVALVADPELLHGIPSAWARTHPSRVGEIDFRMPLGNNLDELAGAGHDASVIVGCRTPIGPELLDRLPDVSLIQQCSAGVDNIDLAEVRRRGIVLARVHDSGRTAVAEHTVMLILALARRLCEANHATHEGRWIWSELYGDIWELRGKAVGVVGMGPIGQEVARLVAAFGSEVLYTRRRPADIDDLGFEARRVNLDHLLDRADVVTLHCPLNEETRGLIDAGALRRMKSTAILVNTARGAVAVETDVAQAVELGWIAGAAIDTYGTHSDPIALDSPLLGVPGVLLTPHTAASTSENLEYTFHLAGLDNLMAWLDGRPLRGVVTAPRSASDIDAT